VSIAGGSTNGGGAPTVGIVGPYEGEQVKGLMRLTMEATAPAGVESVELKVDGARVALLTASPWALDLDTAQFADGEHALDAIVTDRTGRTAQAPRVRLFFRNGANDAPAVVGELDFGCSSTGGQLVLFTLGALLPLLRRRKEERRSRP
jgi:Bacterial Ig domain